MVSATQQWTHGQFVVSKRGQSLFLRSWHPVWTRAVIAIVHDLGSDSSQYRRFAEAAAARGFGGYAIDLAGWGRSAGSRFPSQSIDGYYSDAHTMLTLIAAREAAKPLFLYGHGIGAVIACHLALQHKNELDGVICEGIVLDSLWNSATLAPLRRLARWAFRLNVRQWLRLERHSAFDNLSLPLLVLHGSDDSIAPPADSGYLHACVSSSDKTLKIFEGFGHDLINDRGHAIVREQASQWIETQLQASSCRRRIGIEYINE